MTPKKILILQDDFPPQSFGGAGIVVYNLGRALAARGHDVHVITAIQNKKDVEVVSMDGITVHRIEAHFSKRFQAYWCLWNPKAVRQVKEILREFEPDVVHAHGMHGYLSYASLVAAKKSGARVILTCHDVMSFNYSKLVEFIDPTDINVHERYNYRVTAFRHLKDYTYRYNPFRNLTIRLIVRKYVDVLTAVSDALRQALADNGIPNAKVVYNGIDVETWKPNEIRNKEFKEKNGLGDSVILFGGRISGIKGSEKIVEALALIRRIVSDVQLLVIGQQDEFLKRMQEKAQTLNVEDAIIAPGWLSGDDLKAAYYNSAVVATPTLSFDSFPTMNLEAFACKKPVIATCFGGSREIVEDSVSGYIVNPYNVEMLVEKLTELLSDKQNAGCFGEKGYERVSKDFTLERQAKVFETIYHKL